MLSGTALCHLFIFSSEARPTLVNRCVIQEANRAEGKCALQALPTQALAVAPPALLIKRKWQHEEWSSFDNRLPSSEFPHSIQIHFTFTFWGGTLLILSVWCASSSFVGESLQNLQAAGWLSSFGSWANWLCVLLSQLSLFWFSVIFCFRVTKQTLYKGDWKLLKFKFDNYVGL